MCPKNIHVYSLYFIVNFADWKNCRNLASINVQFIFNNIMKRIFAILASAALVASLSVANAQKKPEREKTVAGNEGGSVRTTVGVELPWCQFAADRLATSHSISGCRGQIEMLLSYQPNERRS